MFTDIGFENRLLNEVKTLEDAWEEWRRSTPMHVADRAAAIARRNPSLPSSVVVPAAQITELPVDHPLLDSTAKIVAAEEARGVWGSLWAGVKGTVRTAFTIFEGLMQEGVERPHREGWLVEADLKRQQRAQLQAAGLDPALADTPIYKLTDEQRQAMSQAVSSIDFGGAKQRAQAKSVPSVMSRAWKEIQAGRPVNLGTGFFPQSVDPRLRREYLDLIEQGVDPDTAQRQIEGRFGRDITTPERQERESFTIDLPGQFGGELVNPTIGRVIAGRMMDQDADAYGVVSGLIDAGKQLFLDPTLAGGKVVKSARVARKVLVPEGVRKGIFRKSVQGYLDSRTGQKRIAELAEMTDVNVLRRMVNTDNKDILRDLVDASDAQSVRGVLDRVLGLEVRTSPDRLRFSRQPLGDTRIGRMMADRPDSFVDVEDISAAVNNVDNFMVNARLTRAQRSEILNKLIRVRDGDRTGVMAVMREMSQMVTDELGNVYNMNPEIKKAMSRFVDDQWTDIEYLRNYFTVSETGRPVFFPGIHLSDALGERLKSSPHLFDEFLQRAIVLPDARQMRRAYSNVRGFIDRLPGSDLWFGATGPTKRLQEDVVTHILDRFMTNVWKPMVLLRPAWMVRVGGEEQLRMGGAGLDSMFNHPMRWFQWMNQVGTDGVQAFSKDPTPWTLLDEFADSMVRRHGGWLDDTAGPWRRSTYARLKAKGYAPVAKADINPNNIGYYMDGWANDVVRLANDPVAPRIAADGPDAVKAWIRGDGNNAWRSYVFKTHDKEFRRLADDFDAADAYIDSVFARLHYKTGGDFQLLYDGAVIPEQQLARLYSTDTLDFTKLEYRITRQGDRRMLDGIAKGEIGNAHLNHRIADKAGQSVEIRKVQGVLEQWDDAARPAIVNSPLKSFETGDVSRYDEFVNKMFQLLGAAPTNKLARSPAFKQFYYQRINEMLPFMDDDTIRMWIKAAEKTGVPDAFIVKMRATADKAFGRARSGRMVNMADADKIAKAYALESTKHLLYDLNKKKNFFDIARNVFPFGEAHFEVLSRWAKLGWENPALLRRGQQIIEGGRNSGFVWTNANGEEMYGIPAEGPIAQLFGLEERYGQTRERWGGRLSALNIAAGGPIPGVGPFVQWPVSAFLADKDSEWNWLREIAIPFGEVLPESPGEIIDFGLPTYWSKFRLWITGNPDKPNSDHQRIFNNVVSDVLNAGLISGRYDITTPEGKIAAEDDALRIARRQYFLRGLWQFLGPSSAQVYRESEDPDGRWWAFETLSREWRRMNEEYEFDDVRTTVAFTQRFGVDPFGFATAKTKAIYRRGTSSEARDAELEHPNEFRQFPATAYYAWPDPVDSDFNYQVYLDHLREGTRVPRSGKEWLRARNDLLGRVAYETRKNQLGDDLTLGERAYLRDYREWLATVYPGYGTDVGEVTGANVKDKMREFAQWEDNPTVANTEAGKGVVLYMKAREKALEDMTMKTGRTLAAGVSAPYRAYLRDYAAWVISQYPEFAPIYRDVMSIELEEDDE